VNFLTFFFFVFIVQVEGYTSLKCLGFEKMEGNYVKLVRC